MRRGKGEIGPKGGQSGRLGVYVCLWQWGGGVGWVYVTHTIRQDQAKANEVHGLSPCILHYANEPSDSAAAAAPP